MRDESVESVLRACQILHCFRDDNELLRLSDIVKRTAFSKTTAHRLLTTLQQGGLLVRDGPSNFRRKFRPTESATVRIGFAAQTSNSSFSRLVTESIHRAALAYGVELIVADNRYSPKIALRNAEMLIRKHVNIVLEFQTYESVAPVIASHFLQAGIPVIAIEIPHPGAVYFGVDNYRAGLAGGRALGRWARTHWNGQVDEIILLREHIAGPLPGSRVTGMLAGIREMLRSSHECAVADFDGKGSFRGSYEAVRRHLHDTPLRKTLIAANNDPSALGALKALEDCRRLSHSAVISQNSIYEAREELRRPGSRLIGSVAYFPERYGDQLLPLALSIVRGKPAPPAAFIKHVLVTAQNVGRIYPRDVSNAVTTAVSQ